MVAHVGVTLLRLHLEGACTDLPALHAVCVAPEARGRGLGRAALETALAAVDAAGYPATLLWSEKTALYERFGFTTRRESAWVVWLDGARLETCSSDDLLMVRGTAPDALAASGPPLAFSPFAKT